MLFARKFVTVNNKVEFDVTGEYLQTFPMCIGVGQVSETKVQPQGVVYPIFDISDLKYERIV